MREQMIPVLPCVSLPDTLAFYRVLGFAVTYEQTRPYVYGAVERGGMNVHFTGIKGLDPTAAEQAITPQSGESRLARALRLAARLRDFKNDDLAAARVLDTALAHAEPTLPLERARALAARVELATVLGDPARLAPLHSELDALPLTDPERAEIQRVLERARALS